MIMWSELVPMSIAAMRIRGFRVSYYNETASDPYHVMTAATRRDGLLAKRIEQFTRMLSKIDRGDVRAIHRTRVASRRLREALPVLELDALVSQKLGRRLRKVTARLGVVREFDVLALLVDELLESEQGDRRALEWVAASIAEGRRQANQHLLSKTPSVEIQRIAAKLRRVAGALQARKPSRGWRWALDARVARRASAAQQAIQESGSLYHPGRLHQVRIALKKLRYGLELSAEAAGLESTPELRALKRAQTVLGRLHDEQVLIDRIRQLQASTPAPTLTIWRSLDALTTRLENDCRRLHARFVRQRSALLAICGRVGARKAAAPVPARQAAG
jgi:CHAD domain-containing protein